MSRRLLPGGLIGLALVLTLGSGVAYAYFQVSSTNPQTVGAKTDFVPPVVSRSVIQKSQGGVVGYVRSNGSYRAYAQVTDAGAPSSGISSVTADLSTISLTASAVPMTAGSWTVGGLSYNYRTALTTVAGSTSNGTAAYSVSASDGAGQSVTQTGFSVQVDNTPFTGSDLLTSNAGGGSTGKPEQGDTLTYVMNKPVDPESVLAGWSGAATTVTAIIKDDRNDPTVNGDSFEVQIGGTPLNFGKVVFQGDYAGRGKTITYPTSTMTLSGSSVIITLSNWAGTSPKRDTGSNVPTWIPLGVAFDRAGNTISTTLVAQLPPPRVQF